MTKFAHYPRPPLGDPGDKINYNPTAANYYRNRAFELERALDDALSRLPFDEVQAVLADVDLD